MAEHETRLFFSDALFALLVEEREIAMGDSACSLALAILRRGRNYVTATDGELFRILSRREAIRQSTQGKREGDRISIVLPTRNRAALLRQALLSIRAQTWPRRELIVVDEASTDDTAALLAREFGEAKVIRHDVAKGPSAARNTGTAAAQGDWVFFWDDDDLMHPTHLESLLHAAQAGPPQAIVSGQIRSFVTTEGEIRLGPLVCTPPDRPGIDTLREFLQPHGIGSISISSALWPRALCETVGWDETLFINEDVDFFGRAILAGWQIVGRPVGAHYYRHHAGARGSSATRSEVLLSPALYRLKWSRLLEAHPGRETCAAAMRDAFMALLVDLTDVPDARALLPELRQAFRLWGGRRYYLAPPPRHPLKRFAAAACLGVGGLAGLKLLLQLQSVVAPADASSAAFWARYKTPVTDADRADLANILACQ